MYSAFGVDHGGVEISKGPRVEAARRVVSGGLRNVGGATQRVVANPANANVPVKQLHKPVANELANSSRFREGINAAKDVYSRALGDTNDASLLSHVNVGDIHRAANVRNTVEAPANLVRGKKTTVHAQNLLTGERGSTVQREGGKLFKEKHVTTGTGGTVVHEGKKGGLTGAGKVTFVGGPAAAGAVGAGAYTKKRNTTGF